MLFLIYINDLTDGLSSNTKLFSELNSDLVRRKQWAFQWKMNFNLDPKKQAQEVIFSRKLKKVCHLPVRFNNNNVSKASSQLYS